MRRRLPHGFATLAFAALLVLAPATNPSVAAEASTGSSPLTAPAAPATQPSPSPAPDMPGIQAAPNRTPEAPSALKPAANAARSSSASEVVSTPEERRFVELANEERRKRGLGQLVIDPLLTRVARIHSAEMRDRAYFNHNSPSAADRTPMDRYLNALPVRPEYACVGENLFYCSIVDVTRGHDAFMNSPTHRDNVLFPRYEKIGVGIIKNERGEFWVTQMYLTNIDPKFASRQMVKNK